MQKNILDMLEKSMENYPDNKAFSDDNGEYTYAQVVDKAKRIGSYIGVDSEYNRGIAVFMDKSKEELVSFMGILYSGNFYVPIDALMPMERIKKVIDTVNPVAIICDDEHIDAAKEEFGNIRIITYSDACKAEINDEALTISRKRAIDTDPAYALFTSGSTGVPKGVICCHRSVIDYAVWLIDTFDFNENTIFGNQTQFYFSMSVLDIYATIRSAAELYIIPKQYFSFPIKLLDCINEKKVNAVYWVPTALCVVANLRALDKRELPYLKKILFAGEAMPTKQLNIWRKHLPDALYANLFGPTEITDIGIYYILDRELSDDEPVPMGRVCDNVDAFLVTEDGRRAEIGEIGELYFRGSFLGMGYYDNPEKTAEAYVQNPFNSHYPEIVYKTGDLSSINENGEYIYHGRADFQIKHLGRRIELGEIEAAAGSIDEIDTCACIYDEKRQKIILLYTSKEECTDLIREGLSSKIPDYMIPGIIKKIDEFPNNANGKIDRKLLKTMFCK